MDQSQEILPGHAIFASSEYGYHGYCRIARWISNEILDAGSVIGLSASVCSRDKATSSVCRLSFRTCDTAV